MPASAAVLEALPLAAAALKLRQAQGGASRAQYVRDPVGYVNQHLGEFLWSTQRVIAESVRDHRRTAVPSAHEVGKSFLAARLVAWWIDSHPIGEAFVVTTATTGAQVKAVLWRELRRAYQKGKLPGHMNQTEWWINDELVAFGRKPADYDPTSLQGIHARYVLVVLDEAGGVPEAIYNAASSLAANEHSRILAIGNPDDPSAYFARVCAPGSGWNVVHVDGLESPNFTGEDIPEELHDLLISHVYVDEKREEWGEDSPLYIAKVRGRFPEIAQDVVVQLSFIRTCQRDRDLAPNMVLPVELGVDVGAGGDQTVIRERRGITVGRTWRHSTPDPKQAAGWVVQAIRETGATRVKVDVIGIGWALVGWLQSLRTQGVHGAEVIGVNVSAQSNDPTRFPRLRDQLWWQIGREVLQRGVLDLRNLDDTTIAQLIAPKWKPDSLGRIQVEPKRETKKRLPNGRSPDDADAFLLAFFSPPVPSSDVAVGGERPTLEPPGRGR